jgi:DNA-binding MarR family transcriptional regulator
MVQASNSHSGDPSSRGELLASLNTALRAFFNFSHSDEHSDKGALKLLGYLESCGPQRLSDLPKSIPLDLSTISRHCATLSRDGLVDRAEDPTDGRVVRLSVTTAGSEYLSRLRDENAAHLKSATEHWNNQDIADLMKLLDRMTEDLEVFTKTQRTLKGKKVEIK